MFLRVLIFIGLLFVVPQASFATVIINEIAWMGTTESQYAEWIELYNDSETPVSLDNFVLYEQGGETAIISLEGEIPSKDFFLIKRTTPSVQNHFPEILGFGGSFSGSGLANSGEFLVLKDESGEIVDSIDATTGWPAGDSKTKETMQLIDGVWVTGLPTPGRQNEVFIETKEIVTEEDAEEDTGEETTESTNLTFSPHSGGLPIVSSDSVTKKKVLEFDLGQNRLGFVRTPVSFTALVVEDSIKKDIAISRPEWNFGDGFSAFGNSLTHLFEFPGEYLVVMSGEVAGQKLAGSVVVKILDPKLDFSIFGDLLQIKNQLKQPVNIGGFIIQSSSKRFVFSRETIILGGKSLSISKNLLGFSIKEGDTVSLSYPDRTKYAEVIKDLPTTAKDHQNEKLVLAEMKGQLDNLLDVVASLEPKVSIFIENRNKMNEVVEIPSQTEPTDTLTLSTPENEEKIQATSDEVIATTEQTKQDLRSEDNLASVIVLNEPKDTFLRRLVGFLKNIF